MANRTVIKARINSEERKRAIAAEVRLHGGPKKPLLTDEQVHRVRELIAHGCTDADIASEVGVKHPTIWCIRKGRTYRHVKS